MILRFLPGTPEEQVQQVRERLISEGCRVHRSGEGARAILAAVDPPAEALLKELASRPDVERVERPRYPEVLASAAFRDAPSVVRLGQVEIGRSTPSPVLIAGPCGVESAEQVGESARFAAAAGAGVLRGGAYKPRSSPYAFQGLGVEGLRLLKRAGQSVGLPVVTEILDADQLPAFLEHGIDCAQVGARNMQNTSLLKAIARSGLPVLLKRGLAATLEEWLLAAEYLLAHGTTELILCERGIRTFETATRFTLDLTILPVLAERTHLPIAVDPSHAAGKAHLVPALARAAVAAGADALAIEMHPRPVEARSDGPQALLPGELMQLAGEARALGAIVR